MTMQGNQGNEPMRSAERHAEGFTATRWATNHDWCYRGDNTKYRNKK